MCLLLTDYAAYCDAVHDQPDSFVDTGLSHVTHPCGCLRPGYSGTRPDGSFLPVPAYVGGEFIDHRFNVHRRQRAEDDGVLRSVLRTLMALPWFQDLARTTELPEGTKPTGFSVVRALCAASPRAAHAITDQLSRRGHQALAQSLTKEPA